MFNQDQISFFLNGEFEMPEDKILLKNIIVDRKSKYTLVALKVNSNEDTLKKYKELIKLEYFKKATHNSYAFRIKQDNNSIIEGKNDDGENGAGMCILREIQRENATNILIIVTRYFGGIKLQSDRFKNVINACKIFFEKYK